MIRSQEAAASILVVDDHPQARESLTDILRHAGHCANSCASAVEALAWLERHSVDVVITDLRMPGMSGLEFIRALQSRQCESQIIMVTAHASVSSAVEAMRHGAFDYIEKPFDADQIESLVSRALARHASPARHPTLAPPNAAQGPRLVGSSEAMMRLRERISQVARTSETVLICGESGTGKELVAKAIHADSPRANGALVSLNCPSLSPQLMESELFGHERGAFTSADAPRVGRFELADRGTILLDEVTEIALPLQAKLLRVLQERSFERVGSSATIRVDVRVLASTNRDLAREVRDGRFREDLYFRLAVIPLLVPPLRERRDDLPELAAHFLELAATRVDREPMQLRGDALQLLRDYSWPGNIRELENLMTRATVLGSSAWLSADDLRLWLPANLSNQAHPSSQAFPAIDAGSHENSSSARTNLHDMERRMIESTLEQFDGHREKTAKALGIGVRTLTNKLRAYGYAPRAKAPARAA
ncbi:MAG: sigma-54-dependent Fis family transcriptional regulator [Planctomycetes bacterium]|nr:sigma-54-dependent Fis family transcriptional regulator [Planctomycetota bacterium]